MDVYETRRKKEQRRSERIALGIGIASIVASMFGPDMRSIFLHVFGYAAQVVQLALQCM